MLAGFAQRTVIHAWRTAPQKVHHVHPYHSPLCEGPHRVTGCSFLSPLKLLHPRMQRMARHSQVHMAEQAAAATGLVSGGCCPSAAPALPAFCLGPYRLAGTSWQNGSGSYSGPGSRSRLMLRDGTEESFTRPGKSYFMFHSSCGALLDVQCLPAQTWPS